MDEAMNPYNCNFPGKAFVGYEHTREQIIRGFKNGKSYAVLGGRKCGKTSMLIQLAEDLIQSGRGSVKFLPRSLDMHAIVPRSPADFFRAVYLSIVQGISDGSTEIHNYQDFLASLDTAKSMIEMAYGPNWLAILLIDQLDSAISTLPDSECMQNLRNLLMNSRFRRHFRIVATGISSLVDLVNDRSSPLNNLDPVYLQILSQEHVHQLVVKGFPKGLPTATEELLLDISGRHPYILQGLLERVYDDGDVRDPTLRLVARRFVRDQAGTFRRWLEDFRKSGYAVYQALAESPGGCLSRRELRATISSAISIDDGTTILSYHGVIDDADSDLPRISGMLFCDWFRENHHLKRGVDTSVAVSKQPPNSNGAIEQVFLGGVHISGGTVQSPNIAGLDIRIGTQISHSKLNQIFEPVADVIHRAPADKQPEALQKLDSLKQEAAKGERADHGLITKLTDGIVSLVPEALKPLAQAFGEALLTTAAGPVMQLLLKKLTGQ